MNSTLKAGLSGWSIKATDENVPSLETLIQLGASHHKTRQDALWA